MVNAHTDFLPVIGFFDIYKSFFEQMGFVVLRAHQGILVNQGKFSKGVFLIETLFAIPIHKYGVLNFRELVVVVGLAFGCPATGKFFIPQMELMHVLCKHLEFFANIRTQTVDNGNRSVLPYGRKQSFTHFTCLFTGVIAKETLIDSFAMFIIMTRVIQMYATTHADPVVVCFSDVVFHFLSLCIMSPKFNFCRPKNMSNSWHTLRAHSNLTLRLSNINHPNSRMPFTDARNHIFWISVRRGATITGMLASFICFVNHSW